MTQQCSASTAPQLESVLVQITASLVAAEHPGAAVLRLVTEACAAFLGGPAVGIMLTDPRGGAEVVFASDEQARFLELLQTQIEEGPCIECIRTGQLITVADLNAEDRWPEFTAAAAEAGYRGVHAVPMRLAGRTLGGVNLLYATARQLSTTETDLAQTLSALAVLGLCQELDPEHRWNRVTERTLTALNDRVTLAQAIGLVTGTLDTHPEQARTLIHRYAREAHLSLQQVSRAITGGTLLPSEVVEDQDGARTEG